LKDFNNIFRPIKWNEIKGQEHVVKILKSQAINKKGLANSYLFSGKSGIGKTTLARLFFMSLNCQDLSKEGNPCLKCPSCLNFKFDLLEINASDNRGIDDIRTLSKEIYYKSPISKYKGILLDECFLGSTPVLLEDMTYEKIGNIVKHKKEKKVLSYNLKTNKIESKKIIGYFRKKVNLQKTITIKTQHGNKFTCTDNHKILTDKGYKRADKLQKKSIIYEIRNKIPSNIKQVLLGTILGDGYLGKMKNTVRLKMNHSYKQLKYITYKRDIISKVIDCSKLSTTDRINKDTFGDKFTGYNTKSSWFLTDIYPLIYKNKKKYINKKIFNQFTYISLAFLYMDDGSMSKSGNAHLHICGFSNEEVKMFSMFLNKKFKLKNTAYITGKYPSIRFSKESSLKLFKNISPYVIPSMRYKLAGDLLPFDNDFFNNCTKSYEIKPAKIKNIDYKKHKWTVEVFDIEVEDNHNFLVGNNYSLGLSNIVSNCHMLSKPAWNCLLKPLEDASNDFIWILCTTELNKVLKTIQTRCQTYKLNPIRWKDIFDRIEELTKELKMDVDEKTIWTIARNSDTNLRQAIHLLEQYSNSGDIREFLSDEVNVDFLDGVAREDLTLIWKSFLGWKQNYPDINTFINFLKYDLMTCLKIKMNMPLTNVAPYRVKTYEKIAGDIPEDILIKYFEEIINIEERVGGVYDYNSLFFNMLCKIRKEKK